MDFGTIIDVFLIGFTSLLLGYCVFLNRNIKKFNESKNNFADAVSEFIKSYTAAEETLSAIRETLEFSEKKIEQKIVEGEKLFTELEFIVQTGNNIADRIESSSRIAPVTPVNENTAEPKTKIEQLLQQKLAQARR